MKDKSSGLWALSPLFLFLLVYVVISLIIGDFYKIPLSVALLIATIWAMVVVRGKSMVERVEVFAKEAGNPIVLYMIWIFILAGVFANLADKTGGVSATVALTMNRLPTAFIIPGFFTAACLISMAIGTSVGTVVALIPLAVNYTQHTDASLPFFVAVVIGGAFFGDNLSFISDTTIAATRTQGCKMNEKFKANLIIVLPAALITLAIYLFGNFTANAVDTFENVNYWLIIPYVVVIILAISGINVSLTLLSGIFLTIIIALIQGTGIFEILGLMGDGIDSMGNLIIVTILASGMLGLIKAAGGVDYLLRILSKRISGVKGARFCITALVAIVNLCTANNTVAILTVGSLSKNIADDYGLKPRNTASLLDTSSCIIQCLIPYGAQTLIATTLAGIGPTEPWPYFFYPWALLACLITFIIFRKNPRSIKVRSSNFN